MSNSFAVNVVLDQFEFVTYEKVIQKELDLFDKFPNLKFEFNVMPAAAVGAVAALHAS